LAERMLLLLLLLLLHQHFTFISSNTKQEEASFRTLKVGN